MAAKKRASADLTGIRQRGGTFQVRIFGGTDPVTGKQVILTDSAATQAEAIAIRDGLQKQVRDRTAVRTNVTLGYLLDEWLAGHQVEPSTRASYALLIKKFIAPALGDHTLSKLTKLGPRPYEQLYAELRACRRRCHGSTFTEHRTSRPHECDARCRPHECTPLAASSIRQCHAVLSCAYTAAVRWGWIAFNPMESAQKPRPPAPDPDPPSTADAARIMAAAWAEDDDWGTLIWLTLVTGARRGELLALRWEHVDLTNGVLTIRGSASEHGGSTRVKDTKTHQMRRISLDSATVELLTDHKARTAQQCGDVGASFDDRCFLFSYAPDNRRPCSPSGVTHRYSRMVKDLGVQTHLHSMRHYSATELLSAGVDLAHGGRTARPRGRRSHHAQGLRSVGRQRRPGRGKDARRPAPPTAPRTATFGRRRRRARPRLSQLTSAE